MDAFDDFFTGLARHDHQRAAQVAGYEHEVVLFLLRSAKLEPREAAARTDLTSGWEKFDLDWFNATFPRFPLRLLASQVPYLHKTTLADMDMRFSKLPVLLAYLEQADTVGFDLDNEHVGFVFPWPEVSRYYVIHNYPRTYERAVYLDTDTGLGTRHCRRLGKQIYVLERVASFLKDIGNEWSVASG